MRHWSDNNIRDLTEKFIVNDEFDSFLEIFLKLSIQLFYCIKFYKNKRISVRFNFNKRDNV